MTEHETTKIEKEPCPFCGSTNLGIYYTNRIPGCAADIVGYVVCSDCGARGPTVGVESFGQSEKVWERWNASGSLREATTNE